MATGKDNKKKRNFKELNKEDFDNHVREFTLSLYHKGFIDKDWNIQKTILRTKFLEFCDEKGIVYQRNTDTKIEAILKEKNVLFNRERDPKLFCFQFRTIFEYEHSIIEKLDAQQINKTETQTLLQQISEQKSGDYEVENNAKLEFLEFQNCIKTKKKNEFVLTNFACYICQEAFRTTDNFAEHVRIHNDMSDFEWLKLNPSNLNSNFEVFYQTCRNSYYLKVTLKTEKRNIKIQRVLTIKSDSITTLKKKDEEGDISKNGFCSFIVDRHVFNSDTEQPVVIIYHMEDLNVIYVEHYFMRLDSLALLAIHNNLPEYLCKRVPRRELSKNLNIKDYKIEQQFKRFYKTSNSIDALMSYNDAFNEYCKHDKELTNSNSAEVLKLLLNLEDIATDDFFFKLTQYETFVKGSGRDFSVKLNVPGSIMVEDVLTPGDEIILKLKDNVSTIEETRNCSGRRNPKKEKTVFHGSVSRVYNKTVCFEMRRGKPNEISVHQKYTIEFRPNRLNFKYQYFAIESLENDWQLKSFLFPQGSMMDNSPAFIKLNIKNKSVENNLEQKQAVMNIVDGIRNLPYIIVGPPGTGKTTTIVESILQVKLCHPKGRILITASSNAACDEVAKRLIKLIETEDDDINHIKMLRIYSKSAERRSENVDEILIESSNLAHGYHFYPALETIADYDVLICTLSVVGRLKASGMNKYLFTHCFIDECAASTETEALIAITAVFHSEINIIIAGDPKQLGPILQSNAAAELGLKCSLMERLLSLECYSVNLDKSYNRRIQTRLVRNFRSHPDILEISNSLFYERDLISCASQDLTHWAINWGCLPQRRVPLIFDCTDGYTKKDRFSTSLFNSREVGAVMNYVKKLMYFNKINGREIKEEDIGIISPYKKQNVIIREELDKRKWYKIATGSVETFQGQEKSIIIISTVRSLRSDKRGAGFLDNPKRLNVMLTRAQALLIIVGNPELLQTVPNWKEAINYFTTKQVLTGGCNQFIKSKNVELLTSNLLSTCVNNLQNLTIDDNTRNIKKPRWRKRARSLQRNKKNNEMPENDSRKVENWIKENKEFQRTSLLKPSLEKYFASNIDCDSDADTISIIPNPPNYEIFNSKNNDKYQQKYNASTKDCDSDADTISVIPDTLNHDFFNKKNDDGNIFSIKYPDLINTTTENLVTPRITPFNRNQVVTFNNAELNKPKFPNSNVEKLLPIRNLNVSEAHSLKNKEFEQHQTNIYKGIESNGISTKIGQKNGIVSPPKVATVNPMLHHESVATIESKKKQKCAIC